MLIAKTLVGNFKDSFKYLTEILEDDDEVILFLDEDDAFFTSKKAFVIKSNFSAMVETPKKLKIKIKDLNEALKKFRTKKADLELTFKDNELILNSKIEVRISAKEMPMQKINGIEMEYVYFNPSYLKSIIRTSGFGSISSEITESLNGNLTFMCDGEQIGFLNMKYDGSKCNTLTVPNQGYQDFCVSISKESIKVISKTIKDMVGDIHVGYKGQYVNFGNNNVSLFVPAKIIPGCHFLDLSGFESVALDEKWVEKTSNGKEDELETDLIFKRMLEYTKFELLQKKIKWELSVFDKAEVLFSNPGKYLADIAVIRSSIGHNTFISIV